MTQMIANIHCPGIARQDNVDANYMVVLVQDERGMFAAYAGLVRAVCNDQDRVEAAEWLAARGSKLRYWECLNHFPQIKEDKYR